jgi:hypothetical protein
VKNWFQSLLCKIQLVPLHHGRMTPLLGSGAVVNANASANANANANLSPVHRAGAAGAAVQPPKTVSPPQPPRVRALDWLNSAPGRGCTSLTQLTPSLKTPGFELS